MNFYLIGIDHRITPLRVRELAFKERQAIELFCRDVLCGQAAVLFTCNRVEIYGVSGSVSGSVGVFNRVKFTFGEIFDKAYFKKDTRETIHHAFRLACGLESQILFESQIVGQLRSWISKNPIPVELKKKWSFVLDWAEGIRVLAGIDSFRRDIADFALEDIREKIGALKDKKLLILGTGKIAELISQKSLGGTFLYFAARKKHSRALKLSRRAEGELVSFGELPRMFYEADAVISATSSPHYIIRAGPTFQSVKNRALPLYIYDLAVPKDVHPGVSKIDKVRVFDMDDMSGSLENYRRSLKPSMDKVESLIAKIV